MLTLPVHVALAQAVKQLPEGGFAYEPKFDGWRLVIIRTATGVQLQTRQLRDVTDVFPDIAEAAEALAPGTVLDGEVVIWLAAKMRTDLDELNKRALCPANRRARLIKERPANFAAFDVLHTDQVDLRVWDYEDRRRAVTAISGSLDTLRIQAVPSTTDLAYAQSWRESLSPTGIEGVVAKRLNEPYIGGTRRWFKLRYDGSM